MLAAAFPEVCWLSPDGSAALRAELAELNVAGGSVYDALVGRAAGTNARTLLTRDRRAERTYRALGIAYEFVE